MPNFVAKVKRRAGHFAHIVNHAGESLPGMSIFTRWPFGSLHKMVAMPKCEGAGPSKQMPATVNRLCSSSKSSVRKLRITVPPETWVRADKIEAVNTRIKHV